jgi:hypothetical protein
MLLLVVVFGVLYGVAEKVMVDGCNIFALHASCSSVPAF